MKMHNIVIGRVYEMYHPVKTRFIPIIDLGETSALTINFPMEIPSGPAIYYTIYGGKNSGFYPARIKNEAIIQECRREAVCFLFEVPVRYNN